MSKARRAAVIATLKAAEGRFVGVTFVKADGTTRLLNVQPEAVKTHLAKHPSKAGLRAAATRAANHPNLLPVYDVQDRAIKSINLDTVKSISIDGETIRFG